MLAPKRNFGNFSQYGALCDDIIWCPQTALLSYGSSQFSVLLTQHPVLGRLPHLLKSGAIDTCLASESQTKGCSWMNAALRYESSFTVTNESTWSWYWNESWIHHGESCLNNQWPHEIVLCKDGTGSLSKANPWMQNTALWEIEEA